MLQQSVLHRLRLPRPPHPLRNLPLLSATRPVLPLQQVQLLPLGQLQFLLLLLLATVLFLPDGLPLALPASGLQRHRYLFPVLVPQSVLLVPARLSASASSSRTDRLSFLSLFLCPSFFQKSPCSTPFLLVFMLPLLVLVPYAADEKCRLPASSHHIEHLPLPLPSADG